MKKVVTGIAIGAGLLALYKVLNDRGAFDNMASNINMLANKIKNNASSAIEEGKAEVENLKGRVENGLDKGKTRIKEMGE